MEWDALPEQERVWWLEHRRAKESVHSCGHPHEVCSDPERVWYPQLSVCYPTMELESTQARYERRRARDGEWHDGTFTKWAKEPSSEFPVHFRHGTTIWVAETDLGVGGDFLSAGSQQGEDEQSESEEG